jgi:hypothetical protein
MQNIYQDLSAITTIVNSSDTLREAYNRFLDLHGLEVSKKVAYLMFTDAVRAKKEFESDVDSL